MVLAIRQQAGRELPTGPARPAVDSERGCQALELAMVMPVAVLVLVVILQGALVAADLVTVQGIAREAARAAAVEDAAAARRVADAAAGGRRVQVRVDAADGLVSVHVRLESRAFGSVLPVWLPGRATMQREGLP